MPFCRDVGDHLVQGNKQMCIMLMRGPGIQPASIVNAGGSPEAAQGAAESCTGRQEGGGGSSPSPAPGAAPAPSGKAWR